MDTVAQAKLLRFVQEGEYYPIGSDVPRKLSCRVVVATNRDIDEGRRDGSFRTDLFFRFSHRIHVPPLRERREDIPLLIAHFLEQASALYKRAEQTVSPEALLLLSRYGWPGNVRELQKLMIHCASLPKERISVDDIAPLLDATATSTDTSPQTETLLGMLLKIETLPSFAEMKQVMTNAAMIRSDGKQVLAAKMLGISQPALSKRLKLERDGEE